MHVRAALCGLILGCSPALVHPSYAPQPQSALVEVTASPPPGRVELVPDRPSRTAVWIDGEWAWRRGRWSWQPGRWVEAPTGALFSPWVFVRGVDGRLWYAPGAWRDASGAAIAAPRPLASAMVGSSEVVDATGETRSTGPTLRSK